LFFYNPALGVNAFVQAWKKFSKQHVYSAVTWGSLRFRTNISDGIKTLLCLLNLVNLLNLSYLCLLLLLLLLSLICVFSLRYCPALVDIVLGLGEHLEFLFARADR